MVSSLGQSGNRLLQADVHPVHNIDSVGLRIGDLFLHEAPEPGEVGGDGRDSHDGALSRGVAPGLVVAREHAHVAAWEEREHIIFYII